MTDERPTRVVREIEAEYDYIVAGGGAAGCVVAARLSEDSDVTVLLLEAGGDDAGYFQTTIPSRGGLYRLDGHDWKYLPVPQKNACKGMKDNRPIWAAGKCLGGGTSINTLMWMRGVPGDFDLWEKMGCEGWSYKDVLPYFLKSENMATESLANNGYHSTGGPLTIVEPAWVSPIGRAFVAAAQECGHRSVDCNGGDPFGFTITQANIKDGVRESSSRAFLRPAMDRKNLHIATHSLVSRLILDGKTAVGVEAVRKGKNISVRARKEVILSAGCIQSPKILMLSGIGPRDHLQSHGIKVVHDLPVGEYLTDHLNVCWPIYTVDKPVSMNDIVMDSVEIKKLYEQNQTGPMAGPCGLEAAGYFQHHRDENADIQVADVESFCFSAPSIVVKPADVVVNIDDEFYNSLCNLPVNTHGFNVFSLLSHPKSSGTLRLRSADPSDSPVIDPNYLAEEKDVDDLVEAVKAIMKMCKTKPFQDLGTKLLRKAALPGFKVGDEETDAYIREMVRTFNNTTYHFVGTCKMGAVDDPKAVCDPQLRVRGIKNLRIVDSGVMPEQPSGNVTAPTIMVAEKASDMIKGKRLPPADLKKAAAIHKAWQNK